jgi:hypothetical protein
MQAIRTGFIDLPSNARLALFIEITTKKGRSNAPSLTRRAAHVRDVFDQAVLST